MAYCRTWRGIVDLPPSHLIQRSPFNHVFLRHYAASPPKPYKSSTSSAVKSSSSDERARKLVTSAASSTSASKSSSTSSNTTTITRSTSHDASRLNPPATTRPGPLDLPERDEGQPYYKYLWSMAKTHLTFYKTGFKGIISNYKAAQAMPNLGFRPLTSSRKRVYEAALHNRISRADMQLLLRTRADYKTLPFFGLIFLVCGEFTPLLVPFLTSFVPPTLHLPKQIQKERSKIAGRREDVRAAGPPEWRKITNIWDIKPIAYEDKYLDGTFQRLAAELNLYPAWWEYMRPKRLYMMRVRLRLGRRLTELKYDDILMLREGKVQQLLRQEVEMALDRRGIPVEGKSEPVLRSDLHRWLQDRNSEKAKRLVEWLQGGPVDWMGTTGNEKQ